MDISNAQRARVLVHALPYIQDYSGKIVVVKYGGNAMVSEHLKDSVIRDICLLQLIGVKVVLVHGGAVHPLHLKCNADLRRVFAAGQIPIVVALAHAHPAAVRVKGGAGHEHKVQCFRFQQLRPLRHRRADAVKPRLPAVRAGSEYPSPHTG